MVDYIPLSRRRRNATLVALATLLVGLVVGIVVGRSAAVTASEAAKQVRTRGDTLGTRIEALTIEYDQAIAGTGDTVQRSVVDALELVEADMNRLISDSPWLGVGQKQKLHDSITSVRTAATSRVDSNAFGDIAAKTAALIRETFGALALRARRKDQNPLACSLSTTVRPSVDTWRSRVVVKPRNDPRTRDARRPTMPTTSRMIPIMCRSKPVELSVTAHVRIAPAAMSKMLSAPIFRTS